MCPGLQEGLRALHRGGIRPGMLIIDDGWQCTDVDRPLRDPTQRPAALPDGVAIDEFYDAELEMLRMGARDIPGGSSLGVCVCSHGLLSFMATWHQAHAAAAVIANVAESDWHWQHQDAAE